MSVLEKIATVSERPPYLKVLIYGPPGAGKTKLAAEAPSPLIIDSEHGTLTLLNHEHLKDVMVIKPASFDEVMQIFWEAQAGNLPDIETFVIDSISELQKRQLDELLKAAAAKDRNRNPYLPYQNEYKENTEILRRLVVAFRDLEKNLIITAHATEQTDESTGRVFYRPAVTPKLSSTLEGIMDLVGFLTVDTDKEGNQTRYLQTMPSNRVTAKTRIGGLDPVIKDPTFQMLLDANSNT